MRAIALVMRGILVMSPAGSRAEPCGASATQYDLDRCADQDFRKADAKLNAAYKRIMDRLTGEASGRKLMVEAQKAWLAFRDAECAFSSSDTEGGSIHPMVVTGCLATLTETRTRTLKGYLACKEGDSCPLPLK